jgi:hypothetical protein
VHRRSLLAAFLAAIACLAVAVPAIAVPEYDYAGPVFGLSSRGNTLYVADTGQGIVRLREDAARLVTALPGVIDVAPLARPGRMWAVTSAPRDKSVYFIKDRRAHEVANLGAFERRVNPDQGAIDSNPFDIEAAGRGRVLVADAAANALLEVTRSGDVDWIAVMPPEDVSTANAKQLVGCPTPSDPANQEICDLPETIAAEPVATSVDVGPDGAFYVTELKGFPGPTGQSRVWRIEPDARHVDCATSTACTVVGDGFTSIVDIAFAPDGTAYVVELDEASFFALELDQGTGGTVNACDTTVTPWTCSEAATGLTMPIAATATDDGRVFAVVGALIPGGVQVIEIGATT